MGRRRARYARRYPRSSPLPPPLPPPLARQRQQALFTASCWRHGAWQGAGSNFCGWEATAPRGFGGYSWCSQPGKSAAACVPAGTCVTHAALFPYSLSTVAACEQDCVSTSRWFQGPFLHGPGQSCDAHARTPCPFECPAAGCRRRFAGVGDVIAHMDAVHTVEEGGFRP